MKDKSIAIYRLVYCDYVQIIVCHRQILYHVGVMHNQSETCDTHLPNTVNCVRSVSG